MKEFIGRAAIKARYIRFAEHDAATFELGSGPCFASLDAADAESVVSCSPSGVADEGAT
jgi:hypothetical protein